MIDIDVYANYVVVCGRKVERPSSVSPSQWYAYWEKFAGGREH